MKKQQSCDQRLCRIFQGLEIPKMNRPKRFLFWWSVLGDLNAAFCHRPIYIRGEAATTTLNPEPMEPAEFLSPRIHGRGEPAAFISV